MRVSQVMVEVEKRVNDGNYGSEKATAQYVVVLDDGDDPDEVVRQVIARARGRVVMELKESETLSVRQALNPPKRICSYCSEPLADDENYHHTACYEKAQDERRARYQQSLKGTPESDPFATDADADDGEAVD